MDRDKKLLLAEAIRDFRLPRYSELPNVGLYLEQTTKYVGSFLAPLGCPELTSSMVSNYVKKGLIPNPVKKQYYAEHLACLFFVAIAKLLLSMENLLLLEQIQRASYSTAVAYDFMCTDLENLIFQAFGLQEPREVPGVTESEEKDMFHGLFYAAAQVIFVNARLNAMREARQGDRQ